MPGSSAAILRGEPDHDDQVVVALLLAETLLAAAFVFWGPVPRDRGVNAGLLAVLIVGVLVAALLRRRHRAWHLNGLIVVAWAVPLAFIGTRDVEVSQVLWAVVLVVVVGAIATVLPARPAALHVAGVVVAYLVVSLFVGVPTRPLFVGACAAAMVVTAVGLGWLRRDRERLMWQVVAAATTDPLTGLLNRRGLEAEAGVVRANAERAGRRTIVVVLDLDGLKSVNDTRGHPAGDTLISDVADHWRANVREGDLIARLGGDEFAIVLPQADETAVDDVLCRIRDRAPGPWSHGWTVWSDGEGLQEAIARADGLMYAEKVERARRS